VLVALVGVPLFDSTPWLADLSRDHIYWVRRCCGYCKFSRTWIICWSTGLRARIPCHVLTAVDLIHHRPNIAPSLGPVLGGILVQEASWRWIFGFLAIISLICLICMILTLPETSRSIAGDGSLRGRSWHISPLNLLLKKSQTTPSEKDTEAAPKPPTHIPNPLKSLRLLFYLDTAPVILINSITYTTYCCLQASLSSLFIQIYGYTELEAGLIYIPFGLGCLVSSYLSGRLMTFDYCRTAAKHGIKVDTIGRTNLTDFPIEIARFRSMPLILLISTAAMCGYGWVLQAGVVRATLSTA
jgi:MFS family permease